MKNKKIETIRKKARSFRFKDVESYQKKKFFSK